MISSNGAVFSATCWKKISYSLVMIKQQNSHLFSPLFSSLGKKYIMGLTGLALCLFVLGHMAGNLLIFVGPDAYNLYGHKLTSNPLYPLIGYGLLGVFAVHIFTAILLAKENRAARGGQNYAMSSHGEKAATAPSKVMIYNGSLLMVFLITHLVTFKYGEFYEVTHDGVVMRDLYRLVLEVFQSYAAVLWYLVALVFLAVHLMHGLQASLQSLGLAHAKYRCAVKCASLIYAVIVTLGFISQPLYVLISGGVSQ